MLDSPNVRSTSVKAAFSAVVVAPVAAVSSIVGMGSGAPVLVMIWRATVLTPPCANSAIWTSRMNVLSSGTK